MKHALFFLIAALLTAFPAPAQSTPFEQGRKYRIVAKSVGSGGISVGARHGSDIIVWHLPADDLLAADSYWYIDGQEDGRVTLRNAETSQFLAYTPAKDWTTYERLELKETATETALWTVSSASGCFQLSYTGGDVPQYMAINPQTGMVKADKYSDEHTLFRILAEDGTPLTPPDTPVTPPDQPSDPVLPGELPEMDTDLSRHVRNLALNHRLLAYTSQVPEHRAASWWCATLPPDSEEELTWQFDPATPSAEGLQVTLLDGDIPVTRTADLCQQHTYTLRVTQNEATVATSTVVFTSLPLLCVTHEGKIELGMPAYVWGKMQLSAAEHPQTIELTARYKIRGATASTWPKHAMNMKLREMEYNDTAAIWQETETDTALLDIRKASSWILDAMAIDRIKMRNRVCFDLWNSYSSLPWATQFDSRNGTLGRFVELWENGEYQGIYCLTDRINRKLLNLKKPQVDETTGEVTHRGLLYKSGSWDYTGLVVSQQNDWERIYGDTRNTTLWSNWELAEPEDYPSPEAWQPLLDIYQLGSDATAPDFVSRVEERFFIENMADWHLLALALCLTDNGNKNSFLAVRNITKQGTEEHDKAKFVFIPWDMDCSLGGRYDGFYYNGNYETVKPRDMRICQNQPFKGMWSRSPAYRNRVALRWQELRETVFSPENVRAAMQRYADLFLASGAYAREQQAWLRYNNLVDDLQHEIDLIGQWYEAHHAQLDDYLLPFADGIGTPQTDTPSAATYDLQGRTVTHTLSPGIYLRGGKKVLILK